MFAGPGDGGGSGPATGAAVQSGRVSIWVGGWQFSAGRLWTVGTNQAVGPWGTAGGGGGNQEGLLSPQRSGAPVRSSLKALPTFPLPLPPLPSPPPEARTAFCSGRSAGGPSLPEPKDPGLSRHPPPPTQELEGTPWAWRLTPEGSPGKRGLSKLAPIQLAPIPHPYIWPSFSSIWPSVRGHRRVGRHSTRVQEDHSPPPRRGLAGPPPVTVL